jgi:hypothetical protein
LARMEAKPRLRLILLKSTNHYQKINLPLTQVNIQNTTSIS